MQQLRCALETVVVLKNACKQSVQESIRHIGEQLDACTPLRQRIERELRNDPPLTVNKGQVIADGVNTQLDELRNIQTSGKDYLLQIQEREIAQHRHSEFEDRIQQRLRLLYGGTQHV